MKKRYYLAYGSNLNVPQMRHRCPTAEIVGTATIPGYELLFKGSKTGSYLTIERNDDGEVPVAVFSVKPGDEKALDFYEGFPTFYYKKDFEIRCRYLSGVSRTINAFAYIMDEKRQLGRPSGYYVETCLDGYKHFGFDENFLLEAIKRSC